MSTLSRECFDQIFVTWITGVTKMTVACVKSPYIRKEHSWNNVSLVQNGLNLLFINLFSLKIKILVDGIHGSFFQMAFVSESTILGNFYIIDPLSCILSLLRKNVN